jgi:predicted metal-dependent hydrolase
MRRKRRVVNNASRTHYLQHKEAARRVIMTRLEHFRAVYGFTWNRVAIRDQRRRWGSCSSRGNLNFNYRLLFLPEHLRDYVVVHELCHLKEMNHGPNFWSLVARACPNYQSHITELRRLERETGLKPSALVVYAKERQPVHSSFGTLPDTITL